MAGDVVVGPDAVWMTRSSIFFWVVDALAEQVADADPSLAEELRTISEHNLGLLSLEHRPITQRRILEDAIGQLPGRAATELPDTPGRAPIVEQLKELRLLVLRESSGRGR